MTQSEPGHNPTCRFAGTALAAWWVDQIDQLTEVTHLDVGSTNGVPTRAMSGPTWEQLDEIEAEYAAQIDGSPVHSLHLSIDVIIALSAFVIELTHDNNIDLDHYLEHHTSTQGALVAVWIEEQARRN